jgi:hypothetical protein
MVASGIETFRKKALDRGEILLNEETGLVGGEAILLG